MAWPVLVCVLVCVLTGFVWTVTWHGWESCMRESTLHLDFLGHMKLGNSKHVFNPTKLHTNLPNSGCERGHLQYFCFFQKVKKLEVKKRFVSFKKKCHGNCSLRTPGVVRVKLSLTIGTAIDIAVTKCHASRRTAHGQCVWIAVSKIFFCYK